MMQTSVEHLRLIRDHAVEGITVKDLLQKVPLSRRVLDRAVCFNSSAERFKEELTRVRLDHAKKLLGEADLPIRIVAL